MEWMILSALMPSIVSGVVVGLVLRGWDKKQKDHAEQEAAQEKQRLRSENVRISLLVAAAKLSYAVAMAHQARLSQRGDRGGRCAVSGGHERIPRI